MSPRTTRPPKSSSAYLVGYGAVAWTMGMIAWFAPPVSAPHTVETVAPASEDLAWPPAPADSPARTQWAEEEASCSIVVGVAHGPASDRLAGAQLSLHQSEGGVIGRTLTAILDVTEDARIEALPTGIYHLTAYHSDGTVASGPAIPCRDNATRHFTDLVAAASTVDVAGVVRGAKQQGLAEAEVVIEQLEGERVLLGPAHIPVAADGTFHAKLPAGRYQMLAVASQHVGQRITFVIKSEGLNVALNLDWRPEVSGHVLDAEGNPVAGAEIFLGPNFDPKVPVVSVVTDRFGAYTMPVRPEFAPTLTAVSDSGVATVSLPKITTLTGPEGVNITLKQGRKVSGFVQLASGLPHAFGVVRYRAKSLGLEGEVRADKEGRFLIPAVPANDDLELWPKGGATGLWAGAVSTPEAPNVLLTFIPPAY